MTEFSKNYQKNNYPPLIKNHGYIQNTVVFSILWEWDQGPKNCSFQFITSPDQKELCLYKPTNKHFSVNWRNKICKYHYLIFFLNNTTIFSKLWIWKFFHAIWKILRKFGLGMGPKISPKDTGIINCQWAYIFVAGLQHCL